ncbi:MAG: WYL domain-containing protein [Roseovarius sp.]|uniref:tellurite resistance TerB family protein n=1 Tax=Roseovarius sp. TaxID=1486281 RepID=UPI00260B48AD|nr:WYL domain-containing protein [Roseovarius sp.]
MRFFSWLRGRTPSETEAVTVVFELPPSGFVDVELGIDIEHECRELQHENNPIVPQTRRYNLEPLFLVIDYRDAGDNFSRRRITTRWVENRGGIFYVGAICHERRAHRTFRLDRIEGVIDDDGVVEDAQLLIGELIAGDSGYEVELTSLKEDSVGKSSYSSSPYTMLRRELKAAIVVLSAAARADDLLHIEEVDRIMQFTETEAECLKNEGVLDVLPGLDGFEKLGRLVRRTRPTQTELDEALAEIANWPIKRIERLFKAAVGVVQADGIITQDEDDFIRDISEWLEGCASKMA